MVEDFHKICRTCLEEITEFKYLFNVQYINEEMLRLSEILTACTSIEVLENDNLPKQVCIKCENDILNAFSFRQLCHKSDAVLKVMLSQSVQPQIIELKPVVKIEEASLNSTILLNDISSYTITEQNQVHHSEHSSYNFNEGNEENDLLHSHPIKEETTDKELQTYINETLQPLSVLKNENNSSSYDTQLLNSQNVVLKPRSISSTCTFEEGQINNSGEAVNAQLTSVKILKEDNEDDERNYKDQGDIESTSNRLNEKYKNDLLPNYPSRAQQIDPNELQKEVDDETLQPLFPCETKGCVACFTTLDDLKEHGKKHIPENNNICKICNKIFATARTLYRHMNSIHNPENKKHLCNECGKLFSRAADLTNHIRIHSGDKPFECTKCDKRFIHRHALTTHIKTHTGQKDYVCKTCEKRFISSSLLNLHTRIHTDGVVEMTDTESEFSTDSEIDYTSDLEDDEISGFHSTPQKTLCDSSITDEIRVPNLDIERVKIGDDFDEIEEDITESSSSKSLTNQKRNSEQETAIVEAKKVKGAIQVNKKTILDSDPNTADISDTSVSNQQYIKKSSARERPIICPICSQDVITHFTRHLFRYHGNHEDVKLIKQQKPRSRERWMMINSLRKQGYFQLNIEKNILHPIRTSKDPKTQYFACIYCLGHYTKKLLYKHVNQCKSKPPDVTKPGRNCLSKSQTFMASALLKKHDYLETARITQEVFDIMRADDISAVAKNDPLICLYGENLLAKHKGEQTATVVSSRMREVARLLMALKSQHSHINGLFDALKPDMFRSFVTAAKIISGYNHEKNNFHAPSLALHTGTNLKIVCDVAHKLVLEKRSIPDIHWVNQDVKQGEIKDLKKLIEGHWCKELSTLALKSLKDNIGEKPYSCNTCDKSFPDHYRLKVHIRSHSGEKPYVCTYCGNNYGTSSHLKIHIRMHTGEKPIQCNLCTESFRRRDHLKRHIIKAHKGEREHVCDICHKGFIQKAHLRTHMLIHTGEREHVCDICHEGFIQKAHLRTHMLIHTGERNHICNICNRGYNQEFILKAHMRIHTGEKPFKCKVCNKAFALRTTLSAHMRMHRRKEELEAHKEITLL